MACIGCKALFFSSFASSHYLLDLGHRRHRLDNKCCNAVQASPETAMQNKKGMQAGYLKLGLLCLSLLLLQQPLLSQLAAAVPLLCLALIGPADQQANMYFVLHGLSALASTTTRALHSVIPKQLLQQWQADCLQIPLCGSKKIECSTCSIFALTAACKACMTLEHIEHI